MLDSKSAPALRYDSVPGHAGPLRTARSGARRLLLGALLGALGLVGACGGSEGDAPTSTGAGGASTSGEAAASTGGGGSEEATGSGTARGTYRNQDDGRPVPLATDGPKIVRMPMTTSGPKTLDPVAGSTTYENRCCSLIYQTVLQYKYLSRPLDLEPLLLTEMPQVDEAGTTWSFTLRDDVYFQDDECFPEGRGRKMTSADVLYSWKRLADPAYKYKNWWLVQDLIVGFDDYRDQQRTLVNDEGQAFDYSFEVPGMRIIDERRFEIELTRAVQQFRWRLAMFQFAVVPREAVERYGTGFSGHPVGSGPFMLEDDDDWVRGASLRVVRNPNYMEEYYPDEWMPEDEAIGLHRYAGVQLPIVDEVRITFYVESQPMWLGWKEYNLDYSTVPETGFFEVYKNSDKELRRSYAQRGVTDYPLPLIDFIFRGFNMEDEFIGGYTPEKRAFRQAICLALDLDEMNEAMYNGECIVYDGPIPPGLDGHPEGHVAEASYRGQDLQAAREKLSEAGYEIGEDGKAIDVPTIEYYTSNGAVSEKMAEISMRNLERVGISLNPHFVDFAELIEAVNNKRAPFFSFAWGSDYPDAENNLALFYSPNVSPGSNHFNYASAEYDALYEQILTMPPGPERTDIYVQMRDMILEDAPYAGSLARVRRYVIHPWVLNFKPTETFYNYIKYWDLDVQHEDRPPQ